MPYLFSKADKYRDNIFKSNMTSHLQPLDAGIIKTFKTFYRSKLIREAVQAYESNKKFSVSMKECIMWTCEAWTKLESKTIYNCFKHCSILSENKLVRDEIISIPAQDYTKEEIEKDRSQLNRLLDEEIIEFDDYLEIDETSSCPDLTNEEIISQILCQKNEINDEDEEIVIEDGLSKISHDEALLAANILLKYVGSRDHQNQELSQNLFKIKHYIEKNKRNNQIQLKISDFFK